MKKIFTYTLLIYGLFLFSVPVDAQPPTGGGPGGGTPPVPIGGVELLLIAGAAFGAKKLYGKKEK